MTLNQRNLQERVAEDSNVAVEVVKRVLESYQDVVARTLAVGESVVQTNFLSFRVAERSERQGRNPMTGEMMTIPTQNVVKIVISERLAALVRTGTAEVDGEPVTLRKLPKGARGIVSVVTASPNVRKLRVRAPRSRAKRRAAAPKTA